MNSGNLGKTYANGEIVVRQGESGDCMFAIQKGRLEVIGSGKDGEVRMNIMEEGEIFGEMAIFEREVRSSTVRALGQARVLTIDKKTFLRRVQEDPSLAFNLLRTMSHRIRRLSAELRPGSVAGSEDSLTPTESERRIERRKRPDRRVRTDRRKGSSGKEARKDEAAPQRRPR